MKGLGIAFSVLLLGTSPDISSRLLKKSAEKPLVFLVFA